MTVLKVRKKADTDKSELPEWETKLLRNKAYEVGKDTMMEVLKTKDDSLIGVTLTNFFEGMLDVLKGRADFETAAKSVVDKYATIIDKKAKKQETDASGTPKESQNSRG